MTGNTIIRPVGRLVGHHRGPTHRGGCSANFRSRTLVLGGMDWRSLSVLPGGFRICGDGFVMVFLSGSGKSWGAGWFAATHAQEVARGQRFTDRYLDIYSSCVVSFLGLRMEFPILVCDLSTDAIIGTDTLGSILSHTLDIKKGHRHDCSSIGYSTCNGPTLAAVLRSIDVAGPSSGTARPNITRLGQLSERPVGEYVAAIC